MFILIEIDRDYSFGVDWFKNIKGVRLGFIGIHFVDVKFSDFLEAYRKSENRKEAE